MNYTVPASGAAIASSVRSSTTPAYFAHQKEGDEVLSGSLTIPDIPPAMLRNSSGCGAGRISDGGLLKLFNGVD